MNCCKTQCSIGYLTVIISLISLLLLWNLGLTIGIINCNNNDNNENSYDCFCVEQMRNVVEQIARLYPDNQLFITLNGGDAAVGRAGEIRLGPNGKSGIFEIITDTEVGSQFVSICSIDTITINNARYNDQITYLPQPEPVSTDCKYDCENAVRDILPVGTTGVNIITNTQLQAQGNVIVNVPGMVVLETPERNSITFISTCEVDIIY